MRYLFLFIFVSTSLANAESLNKWVIEKDKNVLLAQLPKMNTTGASGTSVSARDLDTKYVYPCVDPNEDQGEDRSDLKNTYTSLPRVLFKSKSEQVWICTDALSLKEISKTHFFMKESFKIFFRHLDNPPQILAHEAEIMTRPYDVNIDSSQITLRMSLSAESNKKSSLHPISERKITCDENECHLGAPKCVVSAKNLNPKRVILQFDHEVAKFKKHPTEVDSSKPFEYLDDLLLLATTGNEQARSRIENFPIDVSASATGSEILGTYEMYLKEFAALKCGSK